MKEVYSHTDITRVGYYRSLLEDAQIPCHVRNEHAGNGLMGGIFATEVFNPKLCVVDDDDYEIARKILAAHEFPEEEFEGEAWICPACGEEVDAGFDPCWNCGESKPAE